jgi:HEPN domain-containing protein
VDFVNSRKDVQYRISLAEGFLREAEMDYGLERWRSCVDNAQLTVENAGKAILALFEVAGRTHAPAPLLTALTEDTAIEKEVRTAIGDALPDFLTVGADEHFMTDYGDESSYILPWDLFTRESADSALGAARKCRAAANKIVDLVHSLRAARAEGSSRPGPR